MGYFCIFMRYLVLVQVFMELMVIYSENFLCFTISHIYIYIYLKNFWSGEVVNDCVYISHFIFIKSKYSQEYNPYKIKFFIIFIKRFFPSMNIKGSVRAEIRFLRFFVLITIKNYYGIWKNVWKFQVSTMKIVAVASIWISCVISIMITQCFRKGDNIW